MQVSKSYSRLLEWSRIKNQISNDPIRRPHIDSGSAHSFCGNHVVPSVGAMDSLGRAAAARCGVVLSLCGLRILALQISVVDGGFACHRRYKLLGSLRF
jgi:hypothetical protein